MSMIAGYGPLIELALLNMVLAFSQYVTLRAGVFSLGSAAFAAVGAYAAAILSTRYGVSPVLCMGIAVVAGAAFGALVAVPLARLRGVFQALATLALVQIVLSLALNWTALTDGALGINSIPKAVHVGQALIAVVVVGYLLHTIGRLGIGRGFDIIREDETVAVSLGYDVRRHHMIAFVLSGAIAGLGGAMHAFSSYSITPNEFGFHMVVMLLAMVVLGGRVSVLGPVVGAIILTGLPELLRGFQDYRSVVQGALLMVSITFLPDGVVDTVLNWLRHRTLSRSAGARQTEKVPS
ncbi:MAG: branched-chain amino acid ABC transporter permease [Pseudomonadota bacterium]|nr:branched-chain amino acid ABC transporter permease [Pseudomonadota bacterium]